MIEANISDRIVKKVESCCEGNNNLLRFIDTLLITESDHTTTWQWKDTYKRNLLNYYSKEDEV